jgi:hypothetical protein
MKTNKQTKTEPDFFKRTLLLAEKRAAQLIRDKEYAAKRFGIQAEQVLGYNSGAAYDKVWVTDKATAEKISKKVESGTCNGGYFHGMSLGAITEYDGKFEVMC